MPHNAYRSLHFLLHMRFSVQENFELMMKGFQLAEFSTSEITELLQLLAGLLNLSNVSLIRGDGDVLQVQDADAHEALKNAAFLLGIEEEELERLLQCRRMLLKGDILFTHRNEQQSITARCSLIKFIYSRLFDHIVHRLNESVARHLANHGQQHLETIKGSKTIGSKHESLDAALQHLPTTLPCTLLAIPSLHVSDEPSYLPLFSVIVTSCSLLCS